MDGFDNGRTTPLIRNTLACVLATWDTDFKDCNIQTITYLLTPLKHRILAVCPPPVAPVAPLVTPLLSTVVCATSNPAVTQFSTAGTTSLRLATSLTSSADPPATPANFNATVSVVPVTTTPATPAPATPAPALTPAPATPAPALTPAQSFYDDCLKQLEDMVWSLAFDFKNNIVGW